MIEMFVAWICGIAIGWIGHMTWPQWTSWLERRAAASKIAEAKKWIDGIEAAKALLAAQPAAK